MIVEEVLGVICRVGMIEVYDRYGWHTYTTVVCVSLHHSGYMPNGRGCEPVGEVHGSVVVSKVGLS